MFCVIKEGFFLGLNNAIKLALAPHSFSNKKSSRQCHEKKKTEYVHLVAFEGGFLLNLIKFNTVHFHFLIRDSYALIFSFLIFFLFQFLCHHDVVLT